MRNKMRGCKVIEIVTPKKVVLNGLWFGPSFAPPSHKASEGHSKASKGKPKKPKRAVIWVHGLGSSVFSKLDIIEKLADKNTAVISFNNRGHDKVSRIAHLGENKIGKTILGGGAHEVFTDCVDDIQGAINFVRRAGVKNIYLAGHSTGCQKSIYWAYKKKGRGVRGIVLLAPMSDWSAEMHLKGRAKVARAAKAARALVSRGKKHQLLPAGIWPDHLDAQRFLSLYTPDSVEEIFSYAQPKKNPKVLKSVRKPILVLLAEKDEYGDRPAKQIAKWFEKNLQMTHRISIILRTSHSFKGGEKAVAETIREWISNQ